MNFSSVLSSFGFSPSKSTRPNVEEPSPGSTRSGSVPVDGDGQEPPTFPEYKVDSLGLPEYEYPTGVCVKNTFIDGPRGPPESLVDFMPPRQAQSCPTSALGAPPQGFASSVEPIPEDISAAIEANDKKKAESRVVEIQGAPSPVVRPTQWPRTMSGDQLDSLASVAIDSTPDKSISTKNEGDFSGYTATPSPSPVKPMMWPRTMSGDALEATLARESSNEGRPDPYLCTALVPPPIEPAPSLMQAATLPPPIGYPQQAPPEVAPVLRLAEVIPEPELGSSDYPTLGSKMHRQQTCKPCAFLHTKGCQNGVNCEFCHLCEPGEKKKRQREKRHMQRMGMPIG